MARIPCDVYSFSSKLCLVVLIVCMQLEGVKLELNRTKLNALDFNQIKNELFSKSEFRMNPSDLLDSAKINCVKEMTAIQKGLEKYEHWAMKRN